MLMEYVYISSTENYCYPAKETYFNPSENYPEYLWKGNISDHKNYAYDMVRQCLIGMGYDRKNYGTPKWNPLGELIKEHDIVLLKPNMVLHENHIRENGLDCLITHPSIIRAVIDYVLIALKGTGKIIIGDAPLQSCDFKQMLENSGYNNLLKFYAEKKITNLELCDFRNYKSHYEKGILIQDEVNDANDNVVVNMAEYSAFSDFDEEKYKKLRITNYDSSILYEHHNCNKNEYLIAKKILEANVIINLPKPKTHRKAGVTIALKNLIGINTNKEWLPHHMIGSVKEGGDEYLKNIKLAAVGSNLLDIMNKMQAQKKYRETMVLHTVTGGINKLYKIVPTKEKYSEGSWYGNDTIWRTITDLNKIVFYADINGTLHEEMQRKMLILGDMIISGEKEGPLLPSPKKTGIIVIGENPVSFDKTVCTIMGFDYKKIPSIYQNDGQNTLPLSFNKKIIINSNNPLWNNKKLNEIDRTQSLQFIPSMGWKKKLI